LDESGVSYWNATMSSNGGEVLLYCAISAGEIS